VVIRRDPGRVEGDSPPRGLEREAVLRKLVTLLNMPSGPVDQEGPPRGSWIQWPAPDVSKNWFTPGSAESGFLDSWGVVL
jgi:hypothetical protein